MGSRSKGIIKFQFLGPVSFAILILVLLGSAGQAQASIPSADIIWTGLGDGESWSDAANWLSGVKPSGGFERERIIIDLTETDVTVHLDENFSGPLFELNIRPGDTLIIDSGITLSESGISAGIINEY